MRGSVLFAGGAFAVHELRHALADGVPAHDGHGHLALLGLALVLACLGLVARPGARGPVTRWLLVSAALLAVYVGQEIVEGAGSLAGVFGQGGWITIGLALAAGAGLGALLREAVALVRRTRRDVIRAPAGPLRVWRPRIAPAFRLQVLARHLAGRGPPALVLR